MEVALISAGSAIVVGLISLFGVIITNRKSNNEMQHKLELTQAVSNEKIDELTREVREHNNFARRMPVVEEKISAMNHRIKDLENFHK